MSAVEAVPATVLLPTQRSVATPRAPELYSGMRAGTGTLEIAIPVYNEQAILRSSIETLNDYLNEHCPHQYVITIADNASLDQTWDIALALCKEFETVQAVRLDQKGKGRAVREVWANSRAEVVAYMDVDLSTDLAALNPLVVPLFSKRAELAIGTRLSKGSVVKRGTKRELVSRAYNGLLRTLMVAGFSDAQCGFKAARTETIRPLLADVHDEGWFFDAELLLLAEASDLSIFEVPVTWTDDPDTRVNVLRTAVDDLKGVARVCHRALVGDFHTPTTQQVPRTLISQLAAFSIIGAVSTIFYTSLFLMLRDSLGALASNAVALTVTAVLNTALNRRFTFGIRGPSGRLRQQLEAGVAYLFALLVTSFVLIGQQKFYPAGSGYVEVSAVYLGGLLATAFRFVLLREWVFNPRRRANRTASKRRRIGLT